MENVDFGDTADDYARHRAGFPDKYFRAMFETGLAARACGFWTLAPAPEAWRAGSPPGDAG